MTIPILMTCYNHKPQWLYESVESILNQRTEHELEIMLLDDCSTDRLTHETIKCLHSDKVVIVSSPEKRYSAANVNWALNYIGSGYVAICDADDISHPDRIQKQMEYALAHPELDVIGCDIAAFEDSPLRPVLWTTQKPAIVTGLLDNFEHPYWLVNHGACIYKAEKVLSVGGYDETLKRGADVDLWRKMYNAGCKFGTINEILHYYRRPVQPKIQSDEKTGRNDNIVSTDNGTIPNNGAVAPDTSGHQKTAWGANSQQIAKRKPYGYEPAY